MAGRALVRRLEQFLRDKETFRSTAVEAPLSGGAAPQDTESPGERATPYTDEELTGIAATQRCTVMELLKRLIIFLFPSIYVLGGAHGRYLPPINERNALASLERDLRPFIEAGIVNLWFEKVNKKGEVTRRRKTVQELISDYGAVARHGVMEMGLDASRYDAQTHTFIESACRMRTDIPARFHRLIDAWLRAYAGLKFEKLMDWLASIHLVRFPTCALVSIGAPGGGKDLLVAGVVKLWGQRAKAIAFDDFAASWNGRVLECPVVASHESIRVRDASKAFRRAVADGSFDVKRKFKDDMVLHGAVRVMLTANDEADLFGSGNEDFNEEAAAAMERRILMIKVGRAAADYLESIGGRATTEQWVEGEQLAQHVRWLMENRKPKHGSRFLVDGDPSTLSRQLVAQTPAAKAVLGWVVTCILDDARALGKAGKAHLVRIGAGEVLVASGVVDSSWEAYASSSRCPSMTEIGRTLKRCSWDNPRPAKGGPGRPRFWALKTDLILEWAEENGVAAAEDLKQHIDKVIAVQPLASAEAVQSTTPTSVRSLSDLVRSATP